MFCLTKGDNLKSYQNVRADDKPVPLLFVSLSSESF